MNKKALALIVALSLVFSGCALGAGKDETEKATVYRISETQTGCRLIRETVDEEADTPEEIIKLLNTPSQEKEYGSSLPDGVSIKLLLFEKGMAGVEISEEFKLLEPEEKLLAESSVVLSLSTLNDVCNVALYCSDGSYLGKFGVEDFVEADAVCNSYDRILKLYLPDADCEYIVPRSVTVFDEGMAGTEKLILQELFMNIGNGMENTRILSVSTEKGVCSVDLSEEFYGAEPASSIGGMVIIYSIVNSLCRLQGIIAVHLRVDGHEVVNYGGFNPMWPLAQNMSLVRYGQ